MTCGIYRFEFSNGDFYYGSAADVPGRMKQHLRDLKAARHQNPRVQHVFNKYGDFTWEHLVSCDPLTRYLWEQSYLDEFVGTPGCLNIHAFARGGGHKHTPESKAKISAAMKGRERSAEHSANISKAKVGKPRDPQAAAKAAASNTGRTRSEAAKAKMAAARTAYYERKRAEKVPTVTVLDLFGEGEN